jgi:hypothetical protein
MENGKPKKGKYIRINIRDIEKVNQFKHLGSSITNNNNTSSAINHRIHTGSNCGIYWVSKLLWKGAKCKFTKH